MHQDVGEFVMRSAADPELQHKLDLYVTRLVRLESIKDIDLHIDQVTAEDKTVDVVVDISNKVNSGGSKLSLADLALAKVRAFWPEGRKAMRGCLERWRRTGFSFRLE